MMPTQLPVGDGVVGPTRHFSPAWAEWQGNVEQRLRRKVFFSEEKKQKTFMMAPADRSRPWPDRWNQPRIKSLLVLFFRKEHTYFQICLNPSPPSAIST
jgi:hypothetical protein